LYVIPSELIMDIFKGVVWQPTNKTKTKSKNKKPD
jgi:hypothetical protein